MIMFAIGKFFSQLYWNSCEKMLIKSLGTPYRKREIRIRAPFSVSHPELISIGVGTEFQKNARISIYPELVDRDTSNRSNLKIGSNCYFGNRVSFLVGDEIKIGDYVLVADDVSFVSENHGMNPESDIPYMNQILSTAPINIEDGCWIGEKAIIMPGVSVGKQAVIGAGSIVTKDIPAYSVAVGNPARVIKQYDFERHEWKKVND